MSTRCQILFKFDDGQVLTYRHSDGYPTGVLPDLFKFLKWNKGRNNDGAYTIANYFYWSKKHMEEYLDFSFDKKKKKDKTPIQDRDLDGNAYVKLGYGLDYDGRFHTDIEFFYTVEFFVKNNDMFNPKIEYRIRTYKPVYKKGSHDFEYEYPEQLIKNEKPFIELNIKDLEKYVMISNEEIEAIEKRLEEETQRNCKHEYTDYIINATEFPKVKEVYCKSCYKELEKITI